MKLQLEKRGMWTGGLCLHYNVGRVVQTQWAFLEGLRFKTLIFFSRVLA